MQPAEYFGRYARDTHLEFFRGEDLPAGVPNRPGLYAWYGRVVVPDPERARLSSPGGLADLVQDQVLTRFQRQSYDVTLRASLEPRFRGTIDHLTSELDLDELSVTASQKVGDALLTFLARSFAPAFCPPLYVGKAVEQSLASRIDQHLSRLRDYLGRSEEYLTQQKRALLSGTLAGSEVEIATHSFAVEAAFRRFSPDRLFLVTYSPPALTADEIDLLERLTNHVAFPLCGRR